MPFHRICCLAVSFGLMCGFAMAEIPQEEGRAIQSDIMPDIFPPVASQTIASEGEPVILSQPASEAVQTESATHPRAHESFPLLPSTLTSGWLLMGVASAPQPIPFLNLAGYRANYQLPGKDGKAQEFIADILLIASESEAIEAFGLLSRQDTIATTSEKLEMSGLKRIIFRKGQVDSPAASAQASSITTIRIYAWFPPFIILFEGQNVSIGPDEVRDVLSSLSWRE